jgi:hypothetical protein
MRSAFQKQRCTARIVLMILFAAFLFIAPGPNASAGTILGTDLSAFAILGGAGVTVAGTGSVITGSVGGCCGAVSVTGYPAGFTDSGGTVYDTSYSGSLPASTEIAAQTELGTAMTALLGMASSAIPEASLNNITLGPGVYSVSATDFNGTLTLDGGGNMDALWVFLFASSLTTAGSSNVIVENTGDGAGVYWVLGTGSTTLGSSSTFVGNILANAAVRRSGAQRIYLLLGALSRRLLDDTAKTVAVEPCKITRVAARQRPRFCRRPRLAGAPPESRAGCHPDAILPHIRKQNLHVPQQNVHLL